MRQRDGSTLAPSWTQRTATNLALMHLRKRQRLVVSSLSEEDLVDKFAGQNSGGGREYLRAVLERRML